MTEAHIWVTSLADKLTQVRSYVPERVSAVFNVQALQSDPLTGDAKFVTTLVQVSWRLAEPHPGSHLVWMPGARKRDAVGAFCHIPTTRTLAQIVQDIARHSEEYPRHGVSCVCMDEYARELRAHVFRGLGDEMNREWEDRYDRRSRLRYVLNMIVRML